MTPSALLTLVAIVAGIDGGQATVEGELLGYLRPGDAGRVQYEITVGNEARTINVGTAEVVSVTGTEAQVRLATNRQVLPGFAVRFEVPLGRLRAEGEDPGPDLVDELASALATARTDLATAVERGKMLASRVDELQGELARVRAARPELGGSVSARIQIEDEDTDVAPQATSEEIVETQVRAWAAAWSEQNAGAYLSFYAQGYRAPNGLSSALWEAQRHKRLASPEFIEVTLEEFEMVSSTARTAEVRFEQSYRSNAFQDRVTKTLDLVLEDGAWKIASEQTE